MPAIVSPRKTSSDSSRRGAVIAGVLPASMVLGLRVVSVEVAIASSPAGPPEWCVNHNTDSGKAVGRKLLYQVLSASQTNNLGLPFCGSGSPVYGCSTIGLAHSRNFLCLGLPFCGAGSPVHGCRTIGLAPSRNLLGKRLAHHHFRINTRSPCHMRNRHCTITREHGPWLRSQKNHTRRRSCPADV